MTAGNDSSVAQRNRAVMVVVLWAVTAVVLTFVIGTSFCQSESSDGFEQERRYMVTTQVSERGGGEDPATLRAMATVRIFGSAGHGRLCICAGCVDSSPG